MSHNPMYESSFKEYLARILFSRGCIGNLKTFVTFHAWFTHKLNINVAHFLFLLVHRKQVMKPGHFGVLPTCTLSHIENQWPVSLELDMLFNCNLLYLAVTLSVWLCGAQTQYIFACYMTLGCAFNASKMLSFTTGNHYFYFLTLSPDKQLM